MDNYKIMNHYCQKTEELREIAKIDGAPIEVNSHFLDTDLKILTGLIEPPFYAGFSGSRKSILPGISSFETMKFMHFFKVIDQYQNVLLPLGIPSKKNATILVTCGCEEGLGSEEFCTIMRSNLTPADFNLHHSDPDNFVIDGSTGLLLS